MHSRDFQHTVREEDAPAHLACLVAQGYVQDLGEIDGDGHNNNNDDDNNSDGSRCACGVGVRW